MTNERLTGRLLGFLVLLALILSREGIVVAAGDPPPLPGVCSESDRFGFWQSAAPPDRYDVAQLHAGWYTSWTVRVNPPRPAGLEFVQLVRVSGDGPWEDAACSACPTWDEARTIAQRNPGSVWFIGNEPDRQDYVEAGRYAELYHEFYTFLKAEDPSCQVAIGGVVQPTPIRLQYLDLILDAYKARYGGPMPVDVWNVHNYVIREGVTGWGCGVPPGTDPALAIEYGIQDHDNVDYWIGHLVAMREWMRERGYRDRPLVITEFGILMPEMYGYDYARVRDFMLATFEWLTTASDPETGYPVDGNRLVQAWAWFNLDQPTFEMFPVWNHLFDPDTREIMPLGLEFGAYTAPLMTPLPGSLDLEPTAVRTGRVELGGGGRLTATVTAEVYNGGGRTADGVVVRFEREGVPAGEVTIPTVAAGGTVRASVVWPNLVAGVYQVGVDVNPDGQIVECDRTNNSLSASLLIAEHRIEHRIYVPVVLRNR